ncbi:hypothetical protein AYL99_11927 [Fonsecaea erecta]|uniref:Uncharacterized protein n=1 Tax=Fonsecaea erecta TaxID=1367422 RepID=A0A178Z473_9EURO|nr:hypothetical protein AYL99_11927 [Fonsecaea erecta]OAP53905.1 hypothetical protein AYL99_11927 [Fonsecaea erecta]
METITAAFAKKLTEEWARKRTPQHFVSHYQNVSKLRADHTEQIFLRIGFKAWIAYFLATKYSARHFQGKAAQTLAIGIVDRLSVKERERIATDLLTIQVHPTVESKIVELSRRCRRGDRRTKKPASRKTPSRTVTPQPLWQDGLISENLDTGSTIGGEVTTTSESIPVPRELVSSQNATFGSPEQERVSGPLNTRLPILFPQYTCGVIRKTGDKASLWMTFNLDPGVPCILSFSVHSDRLEHFAMRLFGAHIETDGRLRYVVLKDGLKLHPRPSVTLQGANPELLRAVCGLDVSLAIDRSPVRSVEVDQAILATACASLEISRIAQEDGVLNLNISEVDGYRIKKILFE